MLKNKSVMHIGSKSKTFNGQVLDKNILKTGKTYTTTTVT